MVIMYIIERSTYFLPFIVKCMSVYHASFLFILKHCRSVENILGSICVSFQNSVFLNGQAKIITSDIICTNGVIHIIDKVLVPLNTQEFLPGQSKTERVCKKILESVVHKLNIVQSSLTILFSTYYSS